MWAKRNERIRAVDQLIVPKSASGWPSATEPSKHVSDMELFAQMGIQPQGRA